MIGHSGASEQSACPSRDLLFALSVGRLRGEIRDEVERHLEGCDSCRAGLQSVDDAADPLIAELRAPTEPGGGDEDILRLRTRAECRGLGRPERSGDLEAGAWSGGSVPRRLGDYRLVEPLGRGGMG